jgi:hypothetical protein
MKKTGSVTDTWVIAALLTALMPVCSVNRLTTVPGFGGHFLCLRGGTGEGTPHRPSSESCASEDDSSVMVYSILYMCLSARASALTTHTHTHTHAFTHALADELDDGAHACALSLF